MEVFRALVSLMVEATGSLFGILCLLWGGAVQFLIFRYSEEVWLRWLLPVIFGVGALSFVALIWLTESFFSLLAIALLPYLVLVLMGTAVGTALYHFWTNKRPS